MLYLLDLARTSLANKIHPIDFWLVIEWHHEVYGSPRIFQAWIGLDSIIFSVQKPQLRGGSVWIRLSRSSLLVGDDFGI